MKKSDKVKPIITKQEVDLREMPSLRDHVFRILNDRLPDIYEATKQAVEPERFAEWGLLGLQLTPLVLDCEEGESILLKETLWVDVIADILRQHAGELPPVRFLDAQKTFFFDLSELEPGETWVDQIGGRRRAETFANVHKAILRGEASLPVNSRRKLASDAEWEAQAVWTFKVLAYRLDNKTAFLESNIPNAALIVEGVRPEDIIILAGEVDTK
jgi:hypothetical protein